MSYVYITEDGTKIYKRGGKLLVGRNKEVLFEIPEENLEGMVLIGAIQVSSSVITMLLRKEIPVTWLSRHGYFFGRLESTKRCHVMKQARQITLYDSPTFIKLCQAITLAKIHNQIVILRRYNRLIQCSAVDERIAEMTKMKKKVVLAKSRSEIMGIEGFSARLYFQGIGRLVPEEFSFDKRSKQPPLDEFNTLLSFGYTLLMYEVYTAIHNEGLHPYFGFFHALKNHHPALASDLMEEWRPILIDSLVLSFITRRQILLSHFERAEGIIYLNREGRTVFLNGYEQKLRKNNKYMGETLSFRESLAAQVASFSNVLVHNDATFYKPIFLR